MATFLEVALPVQLRGGPGARPVASDHHHPSKP